MQVLTIWPSTNDCWLYGCVELCSCSSSSKLGRDRKTGFFVFRNYCHSVSYKSSYSVSFWSEGVSSLIWQNHKLTSKWFSSYCEKKRPFGLAFASTWSLDEVEPSFANDVARAGSDDTLESKDDEEFVRAQLDEEKFEVANDGGCTEGDNKVDAGDNDGIDGEENDQSSSQSRIDVRMLAQSLHSARTADDVEVVLNQMTLPLQVYSTIIIAFGKQKRLDSAMALFEWLKRKGKEADCPIRPNIYIFNNLFGAMKQAGDFNAVDQVMGEMAAEGLLPNVVTYNMLMSIYIAQGREVEALQLYQEMISKCVSPSPISYSTVLFAYRRLEDGFGALNFFVDIRDKYGKGEIGKDAFGNWDYEFVRLENFTVRICYQVMRCWLTASQNPNTKILRLLQNMDEASLKHDLTELERVLRACSCEKQFLVAKELYVKIRKMDTDISLSACNHVIWLMGKAKKWWAALEIYEDLLDKGPQPDNRSHELIVSHFSTLMNVAREKGIWRWGVRLLNKMEEKGLKPRSREWNSILMACSKASETKAVIQIFKRMVEQGEKPTIISYGALLSALEKGKLYDEALKVWKHMMKVGVEPNLHAYTIMVSIYAKQGNSDAVNSILGEMHTAGVEPNVVTFTAIISGCIQTNQGSMVAYEWFQRMELQNITPDEVAYEMLIEALSCDGKPMLAYELHLRAQSEGLVLSTKAYDAIIHSSQKYGLVIDVGSLGPRPPERKKKMKIRKDLSEFCKLADVPRRSKPFDEGEIFASDKVRNVYK